VRHYETVFIMVPDLPDEEREGIIERYRSVLTDAGGDLLVTDEWGRRRLAYEINGFNKGHYVLFEHASEPTIISEMERQMRLDDQILRYLTIKIEDSFDKAAYEAAKAKDAPAETTEESKPEPEKAAETEAEKTEEAAPEAEAEAAPEVEPEAAPEAEVEAEDAPESAPEPEAEESPEESAGEPAEEAPEADQEPEKEEAE